MADQKRSKKIEQRTNIAKEIYDTERTYTNGLAVLIEKFYEPLNNKPFITKEQLKILSSDIQVIHGVNQLLLSSVEERLRSWNENQLIGDIFIGNKGASLLKLYAQYINNYVRISNTVVECLKNKEFESWLNEMEQSTGYTLDGLCISPIQRIPRYQMLLEQMLKNTWKSHPDYKNLEAAVESVKATATYVNEKRRDYEEKEKVFQIFNSLVGKAKEEISVAPTRRFIKQGELQVLSSTEKPRHIFLFNDVFLITKQKKSQFNILKVMHSSALTVKVGSSEDENVNRFEIVNVEDGKSIVLVAKTQAERNEWKDAIEKASNDSKESQLDLLDRIAKSNSHTEIKSPEAETPRTRAWTKALKGSKPLQSQSESILPEIDSPPNRDPIESRIQEEAKKIRSEMTSLINKKVEAFRLELTLEMERKVSLKIAELQRKLTHENTQNISAATRESLATINTSGGTRDLFEMWEKKTRGEDVKMKSEKNTPEKVSPVNTVSSAPTSRIGSMRLGNSAGDRTSVIGVFQ